MADSRPRDAKSAGEEPHARRESGARQQLSETVLLHRDAGEDLAGFTLNVSRGGLRAAIEQMAQVGEHFEVQIGESDPRPGRVVWVKPDKGGGCILGLAFEDAGSVPPGTNPPGAPTPPPGALTLPAELAIPAAPRVPADTAGSGSGPSNSVPSNSVPSKPGSKRP